MKHLKKIFEMNYTDLTKSDVKPMAKIIYDFLTDPDEVDEEYGIISDYLDEIIRDNNPNISPTGVISLQDVEISISNLIRYKNKKMIEYRDFRDIYDTISALPQHSMSREELEDLFLGHRYKYSIVKGGDKSIPPHYIVDIKNVKESDVVSTFNNIHNVVRQRLPSDYYIKKIELYRPYIGDDVTNNTSFNFYINISEFEK